MPRLAAIRRLARVGLPLGHDTRWVVLFVVARTTAVAIAAALVLWDGVRPHDAAGLAYAVASTAALARLAALRRSHAAWAVDSVVVLSLIVASDDWRSPYYLLWLTTL